MRILKQLTAAEKWIIVLSGLTLALAVRNLGRAIVAVRYTTTLPDLPMTAPLSYFAAMGGFWSIVFLACTMGLSSFRRWARWATLTGVTIYQSNVWFNHLLLEASDHARRNALRDMVLSAVLLLTFWVSLNLPAVRRAFKDGEEMV